MNLTPRPADLDGLSTFTTLEAAVAPGSKAQMIDLTMLRTLVARVDPDGHVSIHPPGLVGLAEWQRARAAPEEQHPWTREVLEAVVDEVRRPKV